MAIERYVTAVDAGLEKAQVVEALHCPACGERVVRELPAQGLFEAMYHCYACRGSWNESECVALGVTWVPCPDELMV